ncbi:heterokaryon incompatibility protein, partial [Colletotrichum lupini]
ELLEGILPESLPHLYRDAACFVRKLGVRYLWIDALCIIQTGDGLADWRHESTLMDKVYSHAFCNLSALSGLDSSNSLFTGGTSILADHHLTTKSKHPLLGTPPFWAPQQNIASVGIPIIG